jgi:hypothetical protein
MRNNLLLLASQFHVKINTDYLHIFRQKREKLKVQHSSSFLPAFLQKRQVISLLAVVMILLTLGVSVAFTHLYSAHAAMALTWSSETTIGQSSQRSPAMTAFNGKLYVVYVDDSSGRLYITSSGDGTKWSSGTFTKQYIETVDTGVDTNDTPVKLSPALAVFNNQLYMAYIANDGNHTLMIASSSDGINWSTGTPVSNQYTDSTPSLAVFDNKLYVAYVASGTTLFINSYDGTKWSSESQVGNPSVTQHSSEAPSLAAFNKKLYVAFVSNNKNRNVLIASYDGTSWSNDTSTGQVSQAAPILTVFNNELTVAFADNGNNEHLLYASSSDGTNWPDSTWISSQYTHKAPALAVLNSKLYIVFIANNESNDLLIVSGS